MRFLLLCIAWVAASVSTAFAQGAPSGFELALHGTSKVMAGRGARFRGAAYRVHGLAELRALSQGQVRARYKSDAEATSNRPWQSVQTDARGFFQIEVPIPEQAAGASSLQVSVGDGSKDRVFVFPLTIEPPWIFDLLTDRTLYEPGETVHVWGRLRDQRSRRPLPRASVIFRSEAGVMSATTDESGVVSIAIPIPKEATEGSYSVTAELGAKRVSHSYQVGTRATSRLFSEVKISPETASPGQPVEVSVKVTAVSGAPVRNASVVVHLDSEQASATSDGQGVARVRMQAPTYTAGDIGSVQVRAEVQHPAYGAARSLGSLKLVVPLALEAEAVPSNGGLVPELDGRLYFKVKDGTGLAPPAGTGIEVTGAAVAGGRQWLKTDADGIAVVRTRLPPGASTTSENESSTTVKVRVDGPLVRTAVLQVPVHLNLDVVPTIERLVVAPGDSLTVTLARRRSAVGRPVVVELLSATGLLDTRIADAQTHKLSLRIPPDRVGVMRVRARPLLQSGTEEGEGGVEALLVRPARPSFPELRPDLPLYDVRSTARLTLKTHPGAAKSWGAVLIRDLALHQGEHPFSSRFLEETFERAVLDPDSGAKEPFLRTVMAAYILHDPAPVAAPPLVDALGRPVEGSSGLESAAEREVLRDPYPLGDELRRRGVAKVMKELEDSLASALDNGTVGELTVGRGAARRFRPGVLGGLASAPATLGEGQLTLAMLQDGVPGFTYHNVARRVARARLVKLLVALAAYLDPGDDAAPIRRAAAREPHGRWLGRMVTRGMIRAEDLADPWGGRFALRPSPNPSLIIAREAVGLELCSAGPDGVLGTADDVRDIFARAVPAGTPYALASGEDALMERLSYLSPSETVLTRLIEAYKRVAAEVGEEQRGHAVAAKISEGAFLEGGAVGDAYGAGGLGLMGHGSGGGGMGGSYSGRAGGLSGRIARAPMFDLAQLVREKFPPTLLFVPSMGLDASGQTSIEVKLPDAVTTYLVEAIVWSQDGWTASTSTQIRVDKKTVVDAPVPRFATVGDSLLLPVRVRNSGATELGAGILVSAEGESPIRRSGVLVAANDAAELSVPLVLTRPIDGKVLIGLTSSAGEPLDAVRRPLTVLASARRVRRIEDVLVRGTGTLALEVPQRAIPREGAEVTVQIGLAVFAVGEVPEQAAWREAWLGRVPAAEHAASSGVTGLAERVGTSWALKTIPDSRIAESLTGLSQALGKLRSEDLQPKAAALLALAPAARRLGERRSKAADLESVLRALRRDLTSSVAVAKEDPELLASLAAGLAATAPTGSDLSLVRELLRRIRRSEIRVGSDTWIAASGSRRHAATALVALCEILLGEHDRAFERVRTLARIEQGGGSLDSATRAVAHLAAALLSEGPEPTTVSVELDGSLHRLALDRGVGRLAAPALARPGAHRIRVEVPGKHAAVYVRAATEYGLPWELAPARPGSLHATIEGKTRARDQQAALELVVQNRSPRTIGRPVLDLTLPAGAELDEDGRRRLELVTATEPEATRGTLHLELRPLPPGGTVRVPLPLRWSVAGRLVGLGVAAHPADQPEDVFILKPQQWDIAATERKP